MKHFALLALLGVGCWSLSGCGKPAEAPQEETPAVEESAPAADDTSAKAPATAPMAKIEPAPTTTPETATPPTAATTEPDVLATPDAKVSGKQLVDSVSRALTKAAASTAAETSDDN